MRQLKGSYWTRGEELKYSCDIEEEVNRIVLRCSFDNGALGTMSAYKEEELAGVLALGYDEYYDMETGMVHALLGFDFVSGHKPPVDDEALRDEITDLLQELEE